MDDTERAKGLPAARPRRRRPFGLKSRSDRIADRHWCANPEQYTGEVRQNGTRAAAAGIIRIKAMKPAARAALCVLLAGAAGAAAAPINLTGTWQPKNWTLKIALRQEGDRVWGHGGARDFWFRGHWDGNRLLLVANNFQERRKNTCKPRGVFAITGTNVTSVNALWWQPDTGRTLKGPWMRLSPDSGEDVPYPYAIELTSCGSLRAYELVFPTNGDALLGDSWPILDAVAEVVKANPSIKIEVAGHTDSTGDAAKNKTLSERRAAAVRQVLVEKLGADAARITSRGWGAEQPIQDNATEDGRAVNRRVEIVLAR
jgi:outer membrane protein OmpA-like peptidoglycan-associated protein